MDEKIQKIQEFIDKVDSMKKQEKLIRTVYGVGFKISQENEKS